MEEPILSFRETVFKVILYTYTKPQYSTHIIIYGAYAGALPIERIGRNTTNISHVEAR